MLLCDLIGRSTLLELAQGLDLTPFPRVSWVGSGWGLGTRLPFHKEKSLVTHVKILWLAQGFESEN